MFNNIPLIFYNHTLINKLSLIYLLFNFIKLILAINKKAYIILFYPRELKWDMKSCNYINMQIHFILEILLDFFNSFLVTFIVIGVNILIKKNIIKK
jgi:hypothetical protein